MLKTSCKEKALFEKYCKKALNNETHFELLPPIIPPKAKRSGELRSSL